MAARSRGVAETAEASEGKKPFMISEWSRVGGEFGFRQGAREARINEKIRNDRATQPKIKSTPTRRAGTSRSGAARYEIMNGF